MKFVLFLFVIIKENLLSVTNVSERTVPLFDLFLEREELCPLSLQTIFSITQPDLSFITENEMLTLLCTF